MHISCTIQHLHCSINDWVTSLTFFPYIDWTWGEEYFRQYLIDYDNASNVHGWQWSASTGTDAVPYFRMFNPIRQSERFDDLFQFQYDKFLVTCLYI
jgi:deoxyribodipyrimidine photolyase